MREILPCPSCGGVVSDGGGGKYQMVCRDCGYSSAGYQTEADAIEAHNEIAAAVRDHAAVVAERNALRAQVAQLRAIKAQYDHEADYQERTANHDNYKDQARSRQAQWQAVQDLLAAIAATAPKEADRG